jgi:hypothetical protein
MGQNGTDWGLTEMVFVCDLAGACRPLFLPLALLHDRTTLFEVMAGQVKRHNMCTVVVEREILTTVCLHVVPNENQTINGSFRSTPTLLSPLQQVIYRTSFGTPVYLTKSQEGRCGPYLSLPDLSAFRLPWVHVTDFQRWIP